MITLFFHDTIWRVQNAKGEGPYTSPSTTVFNILMRCHDYKRHPEPPQDGIDRDLIPGRKCGFESREQALRWFPQHILGDLEPWGFKLVQIHGKIIARGEKQILFEEVR